MCLAYHRSVLSTSIGTRSWHGNLKLMPCVCRCQFAHMGLCTSISVSTVRKTQLLSAVLPVQGCVLTSKQDVPTERQLTCILTAL